MLNLIVNKLDVDLFHVEEENELLRNNFLKSNF